jgi:hypothetical protein
MEGGGGGEGCGGEDDSERGWCTAMSAEWNWWAWIAVQAAEQQQL